MACLSVPLNVYFLPDLRMRDHALEALGLQHGDYGDPQSLDSSFLHGDNHAFQTSSNSLVAWSKLRLASPFIGYTAPASESTLDILLIPHKSPRRDTGQAGPMNLYKPGLKLHTGL